MSRHIHFSHDTQRDVLLQVLSLMEALDDTGDEGLDIGMQNFYNAIRAELQHSDAEHACLANIVAKRAKLASLLE